LNFRLSFFDAPKGVGAASDVASGAVRFSERF
jgi:hypothetical protein